MTKTHEIWIAALLVACVMVPPASAKAKKKETTAELRASYIEKVQQSSPAQPQERTLGSLWTSGAPLSEVATDFKAARLNDTIIIQVVERTSAQTNGNSAQNRAFSANSAIKGVAGHTFTGLNPIFDASSGQQLKGTGQVEADSQVKTALTGQVVSVLPNGNLVVEAQRQTTINSQHDTMIVRGVVRPGDIDSSNQVLSTQMMNLEVELKGKGLVSDGTRGPNAVTRVLMRFLGF